MQRSVRSTQFRTLVFISFYFLLSSLGIVSHPQPTSSLQAIALLQFKQAISKDPLGTLHSWGNASDLQMCSWFGIKCAAGLVVSIALPGRKLQGSITPLIGSITSLVSIDLNMNNMSGYVPSSLGMLPNLQMLKLSSNGFTGGIPASLSNCSALALLDVSNNSISGRIPAQLGALSSLRNLFLSHNLLEGDMPTSLFNASALRFLDVSHNRITGIVSTSIGSLQSLLSLNLSANKFTGPIPETIGEMASLQGIDVSNNRLNGEVPSQLAGCIFLAVVILSNNMLTGHIPGKLGEMQNLRVLRMDSNLLSGSIPPSLGNCTRMEDLVLSHNNLHGVIPSTITSLPNLLMSFAMSHNLLTGPIPNQIGGMFLVQQIDLAHNNLSDNIPTELGKCSALQLLDLSNNRLRGLIPQSLGSLLSLTWMLNLSHNSLEGSPPDMQKLNNLRLMDLSHNHLNGSIPSGLLSLQSLTTFNLSFNRFSGCFPPVQSSFASRHMHSSWIEGNLNLCVPSFSSSCGCSPRRLPWYILFLICTAISVWIGIGIHIYSERYLQRPPQPQDKPLTFSFEQPYSAQDLRSMHFAIDSNDLIGSGASSHVYRVHLERGNVLALKCFKPTARQKLIEAESLVLKNVKHRNLVSMKGFYSQGTTRGILLDYMENGSLKNHLYDMPSCILDLDMIIKIARDVAEGMVYLHNYGRNPIIHGDLKPGNILLDDKYVAHVADFGLATSKGLENEARYRTRATYSIRLLGTAGYIAPEYGAFRVTPSVSGDVYSYGVIVLEMLTRRQPASGDFPAGCYSLPAFVLPAMEKGELESVLDPELRAQIKRRNEHEKVHLLASIGLDCAQHDHTARPSIHQVATSLNFHPTFQVSTLISTSRWRTPYYSQSPS